MKLPQTVRRARDNCVQDRTLFVRRSDKPSHHRIPKDETPLQALHRGCKLFDTLDVDASLSFMNYAPGKEERFVKTYCRFALALTRVELATARKFDRRTADEMMHTCDVQTESDIDNGEVALAGDKATITLKGAHDPTVLRRVAGVWKLSVADMLQGMTDAEIDDSRDYYTRVAAALAPIADDIEAGKYQTPGQVIRAVKAVVNPDPQPDPNKPGHAAEQDNAGSDGRIGARSGRLSRAAIPVVWARSPSQARRVEQESSRAVEESARPPSGRRQISACCGKMGKV